MPEVLPDLAARLIHHPLGHGRQAAAVLGRALAPSYPCGRAPSPGPPRFRASSTRHSTRQNKARSYPPSRPAAAPGQRGIGPAKSSTARLADTPVTLGGLPAPRDLHEGSARGRKLVQPSSELSTRVTMRLWREGPNLATYRARASMASLGMLTLEGHSEAQLPQLAQRSITR